MQLKHGSSMICEHLRVTVGLGGDELTEREGAVRDSDVLGRRGCDLEESSYSGSAFVELARGVQEPWSPAEGHGPTAEG